VSRDTYFENGERVAVSWRHPVDDIEPDEPTAPAMPDVLSLVEKVAGTFLRGNPRINVAAWRFLLGVESESMREYARRIGCTAAAISRQVNGIARTFGMPLHGPHLRDARREITRLSWEKRKRRASRSQPAARAQLEDHPTQQGRS
jgi:hypothetical protein